MNINLKQVTNHGISKRLTDEAIGVAEEFFEMPAEVKASVFTPDASKSCRLYTSSLVYDTERFHFWRDNLTHPCPSSQDCFHLWPLKPARYRFIAKSTIFLIPNPFIEQLN